MNEQTAHLLNAAQTLVATVQVPAFPNNPALVAYDDVIYGGGQIGYGVDYLTYVEEQVYEADIVR